ncbi:MAG: nucleotidyltransferase family protein [Thermoplasmatota archaeon]
MGNPFPKRAWSGPSDRPRSRSVATKILVLPEALVSGNGWKIRVDRRALARFCKKHHIRRLSFFGSVLREDFRPDSDVDVLVEFDPAHHPGFFGLSDLQLELSEMLGRKVDLRTPRDLNRVFRSEVLASAETLYAAG